MSETKEKTWQEKRERKEIRTSASQHETFERCRRAWWFPKVRRLPAPETTHSQAFGTILHAVCERYLEADDLGRDRKTGEPVDLYPEGWHVAINRYGEVDGEISIAEQDQIKSMIAMAIEEGVLERRPDREVEKTFRQSIKVMEDGTNVQIEGFIDVFYPDTIEDHKTSKNSRYLKTPASLAKNTQVLIYAKVALEEIRKKGGALPRHITVRHNQYVKDPSERRPVRFVEAQIPIEDIDAFWNNRIMENVRLMHITRKANKWSEIPEPPDLAKACNAYGGCPYRLICSGRESEEYYEQRVANGKKGSYNAAQVTVNGKPPAKGAIMDLKARMAAKAAAENSDTPTPAPASVNPPAEAGSSAAPVSAATSKPTAPAASGETSQVLGSLSDGTELVLPPWVDPANRASQNDGLGFNAEGSPCKISDMRGKKKGLPTSDMFDIEPMGDGTVYWLGKDGTAAEGMEGRSPLTMIVLQAPEPEATSEPAPEPQPAPEPKAEPKETPEPSKGKEEPEADEDDEDNEDSDDKPKKNKGGRPSKSFVLVVNGSVQGNTMQKGSGRHVHNLHKILDEVGAIIASEKGKDSFYEINAFERRDCLAHYAPSLVPGLKTDIVVAQGVGTGASDLKALVDALIPHAGIVISGTLG